MASANMDIRILMLKNGINQTKLGSVLGVTQSEISVMLKHELRADQKKRIKEAITKAAKDEQTL